MNALGKWVASKPGPFVARTEQAMWNKAWKNFCEGGDTSGFRGQLDFMLRLGQAGFGARGLVPGGFAFDKVT